MILADKILSLRKKNGWSQDELAEKLDVSRQSVSKWEGALSAPDISKIIEMAKLFEVSTDFLLKDELEAPDFVEGQTENRRKITLSEVNDLINKNQSVSGKTAIGTVLCIISPIVLLILLGLNFLNQMIMIEIALSIGVSSILVFVAIAVAIFIPTSSVYESFEKIHKSNFVLDYGVEGVIKQKRSALIPNYTRNLVVGTILCILCVVPLIVISMFDMQAYVYMFVISGMLLVIACAVAILINTSSQKTLLDMLLKEEDYAPENAKNEKRIAKVAGVYWPLATTIFLAWGFIFKAWSICWIIFPIAAVLFGAISALLKKDD